MSRRSRRDLVGIVAAAAGAVMEDDARRQGISPSPVVAQHRPEVAGLGPAPPRVQHRRHGLVHVESCAARRQQHSHAANHRCDQRAGPAHPVGQHRAVDWDAEPGHDHGLPVQRHMLGMLGQCDMGEQRLRGPAAFQQMRGCSGLGDAGPPLRAGMFRADGGDHWDCCISIVGPERFLCFWFHAASRKRLVTNSISWATPLVERSNSAFLIARKASMPLSVAFAEERSRNPRVGRISHFRAA